MFRGEGSGRTVSGAHVGVAHRHAEYQQARRLLSIAARARARALVGILPRSPRFPGPRQTLLFFVCFHFFKIGVLSVDQAGLEICLPSPGIKAVHLPDPSDPPVLLFLNTRSQCISG